MKEIKRVITDGGGGFASKEFERLLKDYGIIHIVTTASTPQNNGIVERMNRTLLDKVRTIMSQSGLPKF